MMPPHFERPGGPALAVGAFHGLNVFSLMMLVPTHVVPAWLFVGTPFIAGVCAFVAASKIYRANPIRHVPATLRDDVPGLREFPLVYGYLAFSLAIFVGCLYVSVQA